MSALCVTIQGSGEAISSFMFWLNITRCPSHARNHLSLMFDVTRYFFIAALLLTVAPCSEIGLHIR